MNDPEAVTQKVLLRQLVRGQRSNLTAAQVAGTRADLAKVVDELRPLCPAGIAGFQPTNSEPDISGLLRLLSLHTVVYLPRVARVNDVELEWIAAQPADLVGGGAGIPNPTGETVATGAELAGLAPELILVPALAVDPTTGARLGYGGGFYDRLLAALRQAERPPLAIGVCREAELLSIPAEPHDQPVDAILTESGLIWRG